MIIRPERHDAYKEGHAVATIFLSSPSSSIPDCPYARGPEYDAWWEGFMDAMDTYSNP